MKTRDRALPLQRPVLHFYAPRLIALRGGNRNEELVFCVKLPWFGLTDGALGAKEWKLGFAYTVHARYGPVLTSSDDSGVVVMVLRPSAVPNGPWRANCGL